MCGMVTGAGEVIFAVARMAGWLAHALEEYAAAVAAAASGRLHRCGAGGLLDLEQ
jgi:citrate synthase